MRTEKGVQKTSNISDKTPISAFLPAIVLRTSTLTLRETLPLQNIWRFIFIVNYASVAIIYFSTEDNYYMILLIVLVYLKCH